MTVRRGRKLCRSRKTERYVTRLKLSLNCVDFRRESIKLSARQAFRGKALSAQDKICKTRLGSACWMAACACERSAAAERLRLADGLLTLFFQSLLIGLCEIAFLLGSHRRQFAPLERLRERPICGVFTDSYEESIQSTKQARSVVRLGIFHFLTRRICISHQCHHRSFRRHSSRSARSRAASCSTSTVADCRTEGTFATTEMRPLAA